MWLINFFKNNLFFQNLASRLIAFVPPMVEHNVDKYIAIKKAFYLTALEQLPGDYLEFGVFTGSSFVFATRIHKKLSFLGSASTRFFGFDSFIGFGNQISDDNHPFYKDDTFKVNADKIISNIKKQAVGSDVTITKGYFEETLSGKSASTLGVKKSRIVFIDCDLKGPSELALEYVRPTLQAGTVLIMDDFFSYKGVSSLGVAGAFNAFNEKYPDIQWRHLYYYGYGGSVYICSAVGASAN